MNKPKGTLALNLLGSACADKKKHTHLERQCDICKITGKHTVLRGKDSKLREWVKELAQELG